jgi:FkbM family methyltransferase
MDALLSSTFLRATTLIAVDFPFSHADPALVETQLRRYPDLILVRRTENISLYSAWNQAARLATTEYIANLNLDDRVSNDYYEEAVRTLDSSRSDVYSSRAYSTSKIGTRSEDARLQTHIPDSQFGLDGLAHYGLQELVGVLNGQIRKNCIPHCAPVWRRSLHARHGYFCSRKFDFCADYAFWLRVAAEGARFVLSKEIRTLFYSAAGTASDRLQHPESQALLNFWAPKFPPPLYNPTHLGERHDFLHHCLNLNAVLSDSRYFAHVEKLIAPMLADLDFAALNLLHEGLAQAEERGYALEGTARIKDFHDGFRGKRAVLLCNGPSLNKVEFSRIDPTELTVVGLNKIFLGFDSLNITPTFIVAVNKKVIEQSALAYRQLPITKILSNRVDAALFPSGETTYRINTAAPEGAERFSRDAAAYVHEGWTVTHVALQILFYMGVREVFIVGMDHRFSQHKKGLENRESIINGEDTDHFDPRYFGYGQTWDFPDLANSEVSYKAALEAFSSDGGAIYDCTIDGACHIFPKVPVDVLYSLSATAHKAEGELGSTKAPEVSVICPFKNPGLFFPEAIKSVLAQDGIDLELLLIDDDSSDYSPTLASMWAEADDRIRVLKNQFSSGVSGARNTGLVEAKGRFIAFLDADDFWEPESLLRRLVVLRRPGVDLVHSTTQMISASGADLCLCVGLEKDVAFNDAHTNPAHLNSVCGDAALMRSVRFQEGLGNGEDWLYLASILRSGACSHFVASAGGVYRVHASSTVVQDVPKHNLALTSVIEWLYSATDDEAYPSQLAGPLLDPPKEEVLLSRKVSSFFSYLFSGDGSSARNLLQDSELGRFLASQNAGQVTGQLRVPFVRAFLVSIDDVEKVDRGLRERVLRASSPLSLGRSLPVVEEALRKSLGLQNEPVMQALPLLGPYCREDKKHWDETHGIARFFSSIGESSGLMIDVGAHIGTSLAPFLEFGWSVFAFEPDVENRAQLLDRISKSPDKNSVHVDPRAVGENSAENLPFYRSPTSTGISGLSQFESKHFESYKIDVVTLREFLAGKPVTRVDFLKIDTEGHDLFVLRGFPWESFQPRVIECEFEDLKTAPLGYTVHDLALFLMDKGYSVLVSEWHPIVRYGIRHDFRQLVPYALWRNEEKAWGNLLAFRNELDLSLACDVFGEMFGYMSDVRSIPRKGDIAGSGTNPQVPAQRMSREALWTHRFDCGMSIAGRVIAGGFVVTSNSAVTLKATFCRDGSSQYEGRSEEVKVPAGGQVTIRLVHAFSTEATSVRLQVEWISGDVRPDVYCARPLILEALDSVKRRLAQDTLSLAEANSAARKQDFLGALAVYITLAREVPSDFYEWNIRHCLKGLSADSSADFEELTMLTR